jgi:RNA polymerase-binding transcription factor DksA
MPDDPAAYSQKDSRPVRAGGYSRKLGNTMNDSRESLERRRDEILAEINSGNRDLQTELDRDTEEQAIQVEQQEVSIARVENLRRELADIEDRLLSLNE